MTHSRPAPCLIPGDILSSSRTVAGLNSASSMLPCGRKKTGSCFPLSSCFCTHGTQLLVSLPRRASPAPTSFLALVCLPVAPLILPLSFPYLWGRSLPPFSVFPHFQILISLGRADTYHIYIHLPGTIMDSPSSPNSHHVLHGVFRVCKTLNSFHPHSLVQRQPFVLFICPL